MLGDTAEALLAPRLAYRGRIERAMSASLDRRPKREPLVRSLSVVVVDKLAHQIMQMARAQHHEAVQPLALQMRINRFAKGLRLGLPGGSRPGLIPARSGHASNDLVIRISTKVRAPQGA